VSLKRSKSGRLLPPKRGSVVEKLRNDAPRVGVAGPLDLDKAEPAAIVEEDEIRVTRRERRLASDDDGPSETEVVGRKELGELSQREVEVSFGRQGRLGNELSLSVVANDDVAGQGPSGCRSTEGLRAGALPRRPYSRASSTIARNSKARYWMEER
jgi:hypothetical protein